MINYYLCRMTEIPSVKGRGRKRIYRFDLVTKETPLEIPFKDIAQKKSIVAAASKYAHLHKVAFATRTNEPSVLTIYLDERVKKEKKKTK